MFYDEQIDLDILKPYFTRTELQSSDGSFKLAPHFAENLVQLRKRYGKPMIVNSCCRSPADITRLQSEGRPAVDDSFHLLSNGKYNGLGTCAIDIHVTDSRDRLLLIDAAISLKWSIGIGKTFLHLDRRGDYTSLPQVIFLEI